MSLLNPNCDGDRCRERGGQVRMYPLGGGANAILCHACWAHENRYRYNRGKETNRFADWPQVDWYGAKIYNTGATRFRVRVGCSPLGSIGTKYWVKMSFEIETDDRAKVNELAISKAYEEGDRQGKPIEHVLVERITEL